MNRKMAFQITHRPWTPRWLKRMSDEYLDFVVGTLQANQPFVPLINEVLAHSQARTLVGFRSMDGGGFAHIAADVGGPMNSQLSVQLTDEKTDPERVERIKEFVGRDADIIASAPQQVAKQHQGRGIGFYINNFHRLDEGEDRAALENLVAHDLDVFIGEANNKSFRQLFGMVVLVPLMALFLMPLVKPLRLSRYVLTYLIPILPLLSAWDGVAALLRLHQPEELEALAKSLGRTDYVWKAGKRDNKRGGYVIYLMGYKSAGQPATSAPAP